MRRGIIERTHPKLSVGAQYQLLSISGSSFYYAPQGETALNLDLMLKVDKQCLETPFYGVRQMTWHLQNESHAVNEIRGLRARRACPTRNRPLSTPTSLVMNEGRPAGRSGHTSKPDFRGVSESCLSTRRTSGHSLTILGV